jgi:hypothetical protein
MRGIRGMLYDGENAFGSNFMKTGITVLSAKNGPFLNLIIPVLLVTPPSAKTIIFAYFPVSATIFYLSVIASKAAFLASSDCPLGIQIKSKQ